MRKFKLTYSALAATDLSQVTERSAQPMRCDQELSAELLAFQRDVDLVEAGWPNALDFTSISHLSVLL